MKNKQPHPVRNGIIATVVGGLILALILQLGGFLADTVSWAWSAVVWTWTALVSRYSVPGWILLTIGLLSVLGVVWILVALWPQNEPAYRSYTEDMLYGAKWRWSWAGSEISDLWCFCPTCDAQLVYNEGGFTETHFICERCPPTGPDRHYRSHGRVVATVPGGDRYYALGAAKREILRRIRTSEKVLSNA